MKYIAMNKTGSDKTIVLLSFIYTVRIKNKLRHQRWISECDKAYKYSDTNNNVCDHEFNYRFFNDKLLIGLRNK